MSGLDSFFGKDHDLLIKKDIVVIILTILILLALGRADNATNTTNITINTTTNATTNATGPTLNAQQTIIDFFAGGIGTIQNLFNINISQALGMQESAVWKVVAGISLLFTAWKLNGMIRWVADNLQTLMIIVGIYLILTGIGFLAW